MAAVNVSQDPYLLGAFAPVDTERDDTQLMVTGHLPAGLAGLYLRNGPNPMFEPLGRYHVFDGDGMLHGLTLDGDGSASYRNRWIRTESFKYEESIGRAWYLSIADFSTLSGIAGMFAGVVRKTLSPLVPRSLMGPG